MTVFSEQTNYPRAVLEQTGPAQAAEQPALLFRNEMLQHLDVTLTLSWPELRRQVASLAMNLHDLGLARGDVVASTLPSTPMAVVAFLACASLGAVWAPCSPALASAEVLAQLRPLKPRLLIGSDGIARGGVEHDLRPRLGRILINLPSVRDLLFWPYLDATSCAGSAADGGADDDGARVIHVNRRPAGIHDLRALLADEGAGFEPVALAPEHPLIILPTGHGHGTVTLTHADAVAAARASARQIGLAPSAEHPGERLLCLATPESALWLRQVGALVNGTTLCLHDGHPAGSDAAPDWHQTWHVAAAMRATVFGASAAWFEGCLQAGLDFGRNGMPDRLHSLVCAGALPDEAAQHELRRMIDAAATRSDRALTLHVVPDAAGDALQNVSVA